jgi:hypothetical protein
MEGNIDVSLFQISISILGRHLTIAMQIFQNRGTSFEILELFQLECAMHNPSLKFKNPP